MTFTEFKNLLNGVFVRVKADNVPTPQCFDVAQLWGRVIGSSSFSGATADLIYNQPGSLYIQIPNTPDNFPQAGDIVCWKWPHVGIATGNNTNTVRLEVFEQNDPTNSECHVKVYPNYDGVIGWLRPKNLATSGNDLQAELDKVRKARDDNWNLYQADEATIVSLNQSIAKLNTDLSTLSTQLQGANTKIETLQPLADQVTPLTKERDQAISDRDACLKAEDEQQAKIKDLETQLAADKPKGFFNKLIYAFK